MADRSTTNMQNAHLELDSEHHIKLFAIPLRVMVMTN
jgi:hypothetical protein